MTRARKKRDRGGGNNPPPQPCPDNSVLGTSIRKEHVHLRVDGIGDFLTLTAHGVLVDLFQSRGRAISHALHGIFIRDVQSQHDRGVVMPQIMKAEVQAKLLANLNELLGDGIGHMFNNEIALPPSLTSITLLPINRNNVLYTFNPS